LAVVLFQRLRVRLLQERLYKEDIRIGQLVNSNMNSFEVNWNEGIVNVSRELVGCSFIFTVLVCNIEISNRMAVEGGLVSVDQSVMAVNPYSLMIMQD